MSKSFELVILNDRFDTSEDDIWNIISKFWQAYKLPNHLSAFGLKEEVPDIRTISFEKGLYFDGINLEIHHEFEGTKLILWGATVTDNSPTSRIEHVYGSIEVKPVSSGNQQPVEVMIICSWEPFYLLFKDISYSLETEFNKRFANEALTELIDFKSLVERQAYKTIFVNGKPQEDIARSYLQISLLRRSYREVPVRGGQSDLLVFTQQGRFLYETKIWRGPSSFKKGLREIEEYILGEDSDKKLTATYFVIFDPTKSARARKYLNSDFTYSTVANRTVRNIVINIYPPKPSKK